jgi:hypothetical protein
VDQPCSITGDKILCSNYIVLANQDNCLNMCKAIIKEGKGNAEQSRDATAHQTQHFCWVKGFVMLKHSLVYQDFESLEETQVVSCPTRMFDDIYRCHVFDTQHAGRASTESKV